MYLVSIENTYSNQAVTKEEVINNLKVAGNVEFTKARAGNFEFVSINGHKVARLFNSQSDQIAYLQRIEVL